MRFANTPENTGTASEALKKQTLGFFQVKPGEFHNHSVKIIYQKKTQKVDLSESGYGDMMCLFSLFLARLKTHVLLSHQMR